MKKIESFITSLPSLSTSDLFQLWLHGKDTHNRSLYSLAAGDLDPIRAEARAAIDRATTEIREEIDLRFPPRKAAP